MRAQPRDLYAQPRVHLPEAAAAYGLHATVDTCLALLDGADDFDALPVPLSYLGGAHALLMLEKAYIEDRGQAHWPRMWGARGLLHVWADYAEPGVVRALDDPHWRVREMAVKVVAARELGSATDGLLALVMDDSPRVQVAALRAAAIVGAKEHLAAIWEVGSDDRSVQIAASSAVRALRLRLGHS